MATTELVFLIKADSGAITSAANTAGTALGKMGDDAKGATDKSKTSADAFGLSLDSIGKLALGGLGIAGLAGAVGAFGAAALQAGLDVDSAFDNIRVKTGATGTELGSLETSFKNVFKNVPADADTVSTAIAGLNTKLGLTGVPLETLTTQLVNLSTITGTDVKTNVDAVATAFNKWGVESDAAEEKLDFLFKTSQATGTEVGTLTTTMTTAGSALQGLGFDFEKAALLMGTFDQKGIDAGAATMGLKKALTELAEQGITNANAGFDLLVEKIKTAPTDIEAVDLAAQTFGQRGAAEMSKAIRDGTFDLDALLTKLKESPETINAAAQDTFDFGEQWQIVKNNVTLALEPVGTLMMTALGDLTGALVSAVSSTADFNKGMGDIALAVKGGNTEATKFAEMLKTKYGVEVSQQGKNFQEWTGEMALADTEMKNLKTAIGSGAVAFEKFGGFVVKNERDLKTHTGTAKLSKEEAKKHAAEIEKVTDAFEKAANPAKALEKELKILLQAHKDDDAILRAYGPQIGKITTEYENQGRALPPTVQKLADLWKEQQLVDTAMKASLTSSEGFGLAIFNLKNPIDAAWAAEQELNKALDALGVTNAPAAKTAVADLEAKLRLVETAFNDGKLKPGEMQTAFVTAMNAMIDKVGGTGGLKEEYVAKLVDMLTATGTKTNASAGMLKTWNDYVQNVKDSHGTIPGAVSDQLKTALDNTNAKTNDTTGILASWKYLVDEAIKKHGTIPTDMGLQLGALLSDTHTKLGSEAGVEKEWNNMIAAAKTAFGGTNGLPDYVAGELGKMLNSTTDSLNGPTNSQVKQWKDLIANSKDAYGKLKPEVIEQLGLMLSSTSASLSGPTGSQVEIWKAAIEAMKDKYGTLPDEITDQLTLMITATHAGVDGPTESMKSIWDASVGGMKTVYGTIPQAVKDANKIVKDDTAADTVIVKDEWVDAVDAIKTKYKDSFTDILVGAIFDGKSLKDSFVDLFKDIGRDVVTAALDKLFNPIKKLFTDLVDWGLTELGKLLGFDWKSIFTGAGGTGGTGGVGTSTLASWGSKGWTALKGLGGAIGAAVAAAPWTFGISVGALALGGLIAKLKQKDAYEAASLEVLRDFDVGVSEGDIKDFSKDLGLTEATLWPIRKDILSSPKFLTGLAWEAAKGQGREASFLKRLENVEVQWGSGDFRKAFETWRDTGEAKDLNDLFTELFSKSGALKENLPNWESLLMATGSGKGTGGGSVGTGGGTGRTGGTGGTGRTGGVGGTGGGGTGGVGRGSANTLLDEKANWTNVLAYLKDEGGYFSKASTYTTTSYSSDPTYKEWVDKFADFYSSVGKLLDGIAMRWGPLATFNSDWGLKWGTKQSWGDWDKNQYHAGGYVDEPGMVHEGEYVVPRGGALVMTPGNMPRSGGDINVEIHVHGDVNGMDDFEKKLSDGWMRVYRRGGFRQVIQ